MSQYERRADWFVFSGRIGDGGRFRKLSNNCSSFLLFKTKQNKKVVWCMRIEGSKFAVRFCNLCAKAPLNHVNNSCRLNVKRTVYAS